MTNFCVLKSATLFKYCTANKKYIFWWKKYKFFLLISTDIKLHPKVFYCRKLKVLNFLIFLFHRIIFQFDLALWFLKIFHFYTFLKNVGPKLLMIKQMVIQMGYFLLIVLSVMFAFGIISQSLMYPNHPLNSQLLRKIFLPAYFVIGTEFYMRNLMMNGKI